MHKTVAMPNQLTLKIIFRRWNLSYKKYTNKFLTMNNKQCLGIIGIKTHIINIVI